MPCNTSVPGPTWARLRRRPKQVPLSLRASTVRPGAAAGEGIPCRSRCGCRRWFRSGAASATPAEPRCRGAFLGCWRLFLAAARLLFAAANADLALLAIPLPLGHPAAALGRRLLRLIVEFHPRDVLEVPEGEDAEGQFLVVQILDELPVGAVFEVLVRVAPEHAIQGGGVLGAETPFHRLADGGRGLRSRAIASRSCSTQPVVGSYQDCRWSASFSAATAGSKSPRQPRQRRAKRATSLRR